MYADPKELALRAYSKLWVSAFISMTGFFNSGLVFILDGLDKQGIYLRCTALILAGNTCVFLCLRIILNRMHTSTDALRLNHLGVRPIKISYDILLYIILL
jgi:hypothetical protein